MGVPPAPADRAGVIPGTVHLVDVGEQVASAKSRGGIELVPRPSDDPEDPLNWTQKRKRFAAAMVFVYTMGLGMPLTFQYSVLTDITADTGIPTNNLVEGTGYMFLLLGFGCLFWQPIAMTYGRRGVYLISVLACVPLMVWTAYSKSPGEWFAHRILLGFFAAPIESLPEVSVPDLFFAHERGAWMAYYVFTLFSSNFIAPLIAGWFATAFGWRWTMHFGSMILAATFVILYFFMEETMYFRSSLEGLEDEQPVEATSAVLAAARSNEKAAPITGADSTHGSGSSGSGGVFPAKRTYLQKLNPFVKMAGRPSNKQMFTAMYLPLIILVQFPSVAWSGLMYGISLCWYSVLNGTAAPILSAAPYSWNSGQVGSIYTGPIIGAAFGSVWSGWIADKLTLWLARRNNGIREPEQRLWGLGICGLFTCSGLIIWGVGAYYQVHWAVLAVGLGILTAGVVAQGSIALSYNVDCFKDISGNSTTSIILVRNTMGFAIGYGITPWYTDMGLKSCFIMAGFLSLGTTYTFLLMIWKGKALRKFQAPRYWHYVEKCAGIGGGH